MIPAKRASFERERERYGFQAFSHPHSLSFHQLPPRGSTETHCSGCWYNSSGFGTVNCMCCWQCQFFLHEQCFLASRSLNHPSHPRHLLALFPSPTYPSASFICKSRNLTGTGFSYSCPNSEFDLHVHCAYNIMPQTTTPTSYPSLPPQPNFNPQFAKPNDTCKKPRRVKHFIHDHPLHLAELREVDKISCSGCQNGLSGSGYRRSEIPSCKFYLHKACFELPREIKHKSYLPDSHPLALLCFPPYKEDCVFTCNACLSSGTAFSYPCSACNFDLHFRCAFLPENVKSGDHNHPLALLRSFPFEKIEYDKNVIFVCDVSRHGGFPAPPFLLLPGVRLWCSFGLCNCLSTPKEDESSSEELLSAALLELQLLELQSKLRKLNADFRLNSSAETIHQIGADRLSEVEILIN